MTEQSYFEQFIGDILEIEIFYIPISLKEFNGFDELKRKQVLAVATSFMIPMSVWRGLNQ